MPHTPQDALLAAVLRALDAERDESGKIIDPDPVRADIEKIITHGTAAKHEEASAQVSLFTGRTPSHGGTIPKFAEDDTQAAQHLANFYAHILDSLESAGKNVDLMADALSNDTQEYGYRLVRGDDGWHAEQGDYEEFVEPGFTGQSQDKRGYRICYKDGKRVSCGHRDRGVMSAQRVAARKERQPDLGKLNDRLKVHAASHPINRHEMQRANLALNLLKRHHGELAAHRLEELADGLEKALVAVPEQRKGMVGKQLAMLHAMIGMAGEETNAGQGNNPTAPEPPEAIDTRMKSLDPRAYAEALKAMSPQDREAYLERKKAAAVAAHQGGEKPAETPPEVKPEEAKTEETKPETSSYSIDGSLRPFLGRAAEGAVTPQELRDAFTQFRSNKSAITAELGKMKIADLQKLENRWGNSFYRGKTKAEIVSNIFGGMQDSFALGKSYSFRPSFDGSRSIDDAKAEAIAKHLDNMTDQDIKDYAGKVARSREERQRHLDATKGAIENPQTLEDFQTFVRFKGEKALTGEQQARYDDLVATARRDKEKANRAASATVNQVQLPGTGMVYKQGWHEQKGQPTHVVQLTDRVDRSKYEELNKKAKSLGGYYSSFAKGRAVPGFQFPSEEAAKRFAQLQEGDVDLSGDLAARDAARKQTVAGRLADAASRLKAQADEELTRDRKTNTARRADMASGIEARARADIAKARTMEAIAEKLDAGEAKHLAGVHAGTHVDTLDKIMDRARYNSWKAENASAPDGGKWSSWEDHKDRPFTPDDVASIEYPYPRIHGSDLKRHAKVLESVPGFKMLAKKLLASTKADEPKFKTTASGFKTNGGRVYTSDDAQKIGSSRVPAGKAVRVHASYDWRLSQGSDQHGPRYSADGGKSWATDPDLAIRGARGDLDLIDEPRDSLLSITDPSDIEAIASAVPRLKQSKDWNLRHVGADLGNRLDDYRRLQAMDLKNPAELRAAVREYMPIKTGQERADPVKQMERKLIGRKITGFFPTPRPLIDQMLSAAEIAPGMKVLEPSAGKGDILDAITESHPGVETHAVEPVGELREIIKAKGHNLADSDIMQHQGEYDRVVMNPPFENGQDMDHVQKAYSLLKPGGKLVAIVSEGPFFRQDGKSQEFRNWLEKSGAHVEKLDKAFAGNDAFRQTGVSTRMVVVDKPADSTKFSESLADLLSSLPPAGYRSVLLSLPAGTRRAYLSHKRRNAVRKFAESRR